MLNLSESSISYNSGRSCRKPISKKLNIPLAMYKLEGIQCPKFVSYIKRPSYDVLLDVDATSKQRFCAHWLVWFPLNLFNKLYTIGIAESEFSEQVRFCWIGTFNFSFHWQPREKIVYFNLIKEFKPKQFFFNHDNLPFLLESAPLAVCTKKQETTTFSNINVFITYNESCWWLSLHPMFIAMDL